MEDSKVENGCFKLANRTHVLGEVFDHSIVGDGRGEWISEGEVDRILDDVNRKNEERPSKKMNLECPAGSLVLFDARLIHGANENSSTTRSRYSFFGHYLPHDLGFSWRGVDFSFGKYDDRHRVG